MPTQAGPVVIDPVGRMVILLGPQGAGKTDALLALSGLVALSAIDDNLRAFVDGRHTVSFCSVQRLVRSRLTVRENIQLMTDLYGIVERTRTDDLLRLSTLIASADQPAYTLPRHLSRTLNLVLALLPDPDVLLIDDVTRGLSLPAQRQLCQLILEEQRCRPRIILFATRELHVARALRGEVWLFDHGRVLQQWLPGELPASLFQSAAYHLELKNSLAARALYDVLVTQSDFARDVKRLGSRAVRVIVDKASSLLPLVQMAGRELLDFRGLSLEADYLLTHWPVTKSDPSVSTQQPAVVANHRQTPTPPKTETGQQRCRGIVQLAIAEWHTHFRRFWRAGNILFSAFVIVSVLQLMLQRLGLDHLPVWTPLVLLLSSGMALGFATESISRLTQVADSETLFQSARPIDATNRLSLLALYDMASIGRMKVLVGFVLGQFFVMLCHSIIPFIAWGILLMLVEQGWSLLVASVMYWLLTAVDSLALAVLMGHLVHRHSWSLWLGWLLWLLVSLSAAIPWLDHPLTWLWPYSGFTVAFQQLSIDPILVFISLGMALLGTIVLCVLALRSFCWQPSIYMEQ